MTSERPPLPDIDFPALAAALLQGAERLLPLWLPGGRRNGHEWVCASLSGGAGRSCSVHMQKGLWSDFQSGEAGGDLISLYAAIHGIRNQGQAAVQVARDEGLEDVARVQRDAQHQRPVRPPPPPPRPQPPRIEERWSTVLPVPANAQAPTFRHHFRPLQDIAHKAEYRRGGELLGYVVRFRTSTGGKDDIPYTWCASARDGASAWRWRQFDEPRPLYLAGGADLASARTTIVCEGEPKSARLHELLQAGAPGVYQVVAWPGGCKAWKKADWSPLAGLHVLLWPDADSKRVPLTAAERKAIAAALPPEADDAARTAALDAASQARPYLPAHKQPGWAAMVGIGHLLAGQHGCAVQILPLPEPGTLKDGWDAGDAVAEGWDAARVQQYLAQAQPLPPADGQPPPPRPPQPPDDADAEGPAGAGGGDGAADPFQRHVDFVCAALEKEPYQLPVDRKLIIAALRKAPLLAGRLCTNSMFDGPATLQPWPWRDKAGPLSDVDHLRAGDWLSRTYGLKSATAEALQSAILTVADEHHHHPIQHWLQAQRWDGRPRLEKWLAHVLRKRPQDVSPRHWRYLALMGKYMLLGLVARVMDPGCKFDYSPVFEGRTGRGKSTLIETLVGADYFSDTHFDIGSGKDGMEQLRGIWAYELSEMTAFRRADSEQVKQFFSSKVDRYRSSYGHYVQPHPRQCVIVCSTNKRRYLYDLSSQRRFWPVWVDEFIRIAWVRKWRAQLFAEALAAYRRGEQIFPSPEDEAAYFLPEQRLRLVETAIHGKMYELLTREGAPAGEGKQSADITQHLVFITKQRMVEALGTDAGKSTVQIESQVASWFEYYEWAYKRESTGARRYGYHRPNVWPPDLPDDDEDTRPPPDASEEGDTTDGAGGDDEPF